MKSLLLVLSLLLAVPTQEPNSWKLLSKVEIERRYDETFNFEVEFPIFSNEVKALDGKPITMEGWMIPLDELRGKNYFHCPKTTNMISDIHFPSIQAVYFQGIR